MNQVSAINNNGLAPSFRSSRYKAYADLDVDKAVRKDSTAIFHAAYAPSEQQLRWSNLSVPIEVYTHRRGIDPFDAIGSPERDSTSQSCQ